LGQNPWPDFLYQQVSEHIDVYYSEYDHHVHVAVDGRTIIWCAFLAITIDASGDNTTDITSIDSLSDLDNVKLIEGYAFSTAGKPEKDIVNLFRRMPDFSQAVTEYQVHHVASHRYKPRNCATLAAMDICPAPCQCTNPIVFASKDKLLHLARVASQGN